MAEFSIERIRALATPEEFRAGEDYYRRGRVRNLVFTDGVFKAYVHRIGHYVVRIHPDQNDLGTSCTCAYDGKGICRHVAAVGLTALRGKQDAGFHLLNLGDHVPPDALDLAMLQEWGWKETDLPESPGSDDASIASFAARQIMSSPVETLHPDASLAEAWDFVTERHYRHVPVVDGKRLVGIVSDRDLLREAAARAAGKSKASSGTVSGIMRRQVLTARPETEVRQVAQVMFAEHVGAIPIVDRDDALVGLVTRSDILRAIVEKF